MRILVTGSEGFIGSHLVEALIKRGHFVRSFIKYNYQSSKGWLSHLKKGKNLDFVFGDIEDYQSLKYATQFDTANTGQHKHIAKFHKRNPPPSNVNV